MTTRPPADGFSTCARCGADLADGAAFCAECGAPAYPARPPVRGERRPGAAARPWWVPLAIIVGGIAAIGGGALLAAALGDGNGVASDPSATPSISAIASATAEASVPPSEDPTPSPSPSVPEAPVIANRSIVEVGSDALNLRQQPTESSSILAELPPGRRLFTIGEPTDAGELRWYRVGVVSGPDCPEDCNLIGHVATPTAADEEPWITAVTMECPSSPMTAEQISTLTHLEALHCYGRNEIVINGTVDTPCCIPPDGIRYQPAWLAEPLVSPYLRDADGTIVLGFRAPPDEALEPPERGDVVSVTGHFEDPAATSCRASVDEDAGADPDDVQLPDPASVILGCRATFVWTDYEVTGFEDLGPCCGSLNPVTSVVPRDRRF
jgi:hypothetical protein